MGKTVGKSHGLVERSILVEVEHVKAHRTKKEKNIMSQFQMFITEGNEKADDSTKANAMLNKKNVAKAGAKTMNAAGK